jgi:uncharacterized lipoprotein YajG
MRNPILRRLLLAAPLATLAACGRDQAGIDAAPTAATTAAGGSATVTAVVQPQRLTLVPVDVRRYPVGPARDIAVQPVVAGERLHLEPVTQ